MQQTAKHLIPTYTSNGKGVTRLDGAADVLEHALVKDGTSELHVAALQALLETAATDADAFAARYQTRLPWLQGFLSHIDEEGKLPCLESPCFSTALAFVLFKYLPLGAKG